MRCLKVRHRGWEWGGKQGNMTPSPSTLALGYTRFVFRAVCRTHSTQANFAQTVIQDKWTDGLGKKTGLGMAFYLDFTGYSHSPQYLS